MCYFKVFVEIFGAKIDLNREMQQGILIFSP